jgi:hypothetical protein
MGRKKRKAAELDAADDELLSADAPPNEEPKAAVAATAAALVEPETKAAPTSSSYAVTSHSAEIVGEDIYVSDGSEDEEEELAEIQLAGSRMGLMRRGLHQPGLFQPNRQWQRDIVGETAEANEGEDEKAREEELAKLDPVERAKRLLAEKQRKLEEAKEAARRHESEENAGRDPCLFSKRTAFDIRMDQIEDKPWNNGADITDYFNYSMGEEDWVEYSQNQLQIRQELTDASRQRRPPDPNIVPVTPKTPAKQAPRVAVAVKETSDSTDADGDVNMATEENVVLGPTMVKQEEKKESKDGDTEKMDTVGDVGGGAWGAGAAPGSMLAKLIEEQERKNEEEEEAAAAAAAAAAAGQQQQEPDRYSNRGGGGDYYGSEASGGGDYYGGGGGGGGSDEYYGGGREQFPPNQAPAFRGGRGRGGFGRPPPNVPHYNTPPPWAGRGGRRGGFRGGYNDGYGGGYRR